MILAHERSQRYRDRVDCCFSLGRVLLLQVTNACNQSCIHCMRSAELVRAEPLDLGCLRSALTACKERLSPARVVISGGEPTLVPNLAELVGLLHRLELRSSLCTNAVRVDTSLARRLAGQGLASATVGVEGVDDGYTWFRGSHGFERIARGIVALSASGIAVTVNVTVHDRILEQADDFARMLSGHRLASVSVTSPIAQGRALGAAAVFGAVTEARVVTFANGLAQRLECPVSLRVPRCDVGSCPSGRSVFSMGRDGVVAHCPDVGATNVCDHAQSGEAA